MEINILSIYKKVVKHNKKIDDKNKNTTTKDIEKVSLAEMLSADIMKNPKKYKEE